MSAQLIALYRRCNPQFTFDSRRVCRRCLSDDTVAAQGSVDNIHGDYILRVADVIVAEPSRRLVVLGLLGKGAYGQVAKVRDEASGQLRALKIIKNIPEYCRQALTEIEILRHLWQQQRLWTKHPRFVELHSHFFFRNHLCIELELLSISMHDLLRQNHYRGLSLDRIRVITLQLLEALAILQEAGIIHCDVKPENILFELERSDESTTIGCIKLIDFGSACRIGQAPQPHIQSRLYQAPELLLDADRGQSIDVWSLGCVLAELALGLPLFASTS
jgi:dual specificity protein kinase YAK1